MWSNDENLLRAATALCALQRVEAKRMVVIGSQTVLIQSGSRTYYRLEYSTLWSRWHFERATLVSIQEMNTLASTGALTEMLPPSTDSRGIEATAGKKKWWQL